MRIMTQWFMVCSVLMGGVYFFPSSVEIEPLYMVFVLGAVIRLLNVTLRPLLLLVTLPFTLITLGFFILVINGFVFHLAALWIEGVSYSFWTAVLLALITAALDTLIQRPSTKFVFNVQRRHPRGSDHDEIEDVSFIEVDAKK